LRILVVTWTFPPFNAMGAIRVGKFSSYLLRQGHDVWVLSARDVDLPQTLDSDFPDSQVSRTRLPDVNWPSRFASRLVRALKNTLKGSSPASPGADSGAAASGPQLDHEVRKGLLKRIDQLYMNITNIPDAFVGWTPFAVRSGSKLLRSREFDLIFASGPPFIVLLIGYVLSRRHRVPWVMEFRDRWADDLY